MSKHNDKSSSKVSPFTPNTKSIFNFGVHVAHDLFYLQTRDEDVSMDPFLRNSLLFRKKMFGSMLDPHTKPGAVRTRAPISPLLQLQFLTVIILPHGLTTVFLVSGQNWLRWIRRTNKVLSACILFYLILPLIAELSTKISWLCGVRFIEKLTKVFIVSLNLSMKKSLTCNFIS